jgi:hypothetical protein
LKERLHTRSYPLQAVRGLDNGSSRALRASCLQHVQNRAVEAGLCSNTTPLRCFRKCHETRRSEVVKVLGGHAGRPGEATQSAERHPPLTCRCREPAKPAQTLVSSPDTGCVSEPAAKRRIEGAVAARFPHTNVAKSQGGVPSGTQQRGRRRPAQRQELWRRWREGTTADPHRQIGRQR